MKYPVFELSAITLEMREFELFVSLEVIEVKDELKLILINFDIAEEPVLIDIIKSDPLLYNKAPL
jgi:hypothetical protein